MTGGRIDPSGVTCGADGTTNSMNLWCENIVTTKITADYIKGKIADLDINFSGSIIVYDFSCSHAAFYKGSEIANHYWVENQKYAKETDIPSLNTTNINGVTVYCP